MRASESHEAQRSRKWLLVAVLAVAAVAAAAAWLVVRPQETKAPASITSPPTSSSLVLTAPSAGFTTTDATPIYAGAVREADADRAVTVRVYKGSSASAPPLRRCG